MNNKFLIVIAGPTAVGKTALAIEVAKAFGTVVISADSRQLFREMRIGTARPTEQEMQHVPHYFIASHSITEDYNVGRFEADTPRLLDRLFREKEIVVMAGGTGLYIDAVCNGMDEVPQSDENIREMLMSVYEEKGLEALHEMLKEKDPVYYEQVDLHNPHRVMRAVEVCLITGKPYSSFRKGGKKQRNFNVIKIGLNMERDALYDRINRRVDEMMRSGLLEEAKELYAHRHRNALQTVGYKELFEHLEGSTDLNTAVELIRRNTRRFAKRQMTWFKRDAEMTWFDPGEKETIIRFIKEKTKSAGGSPV